MLQLYFQSPTIFPFRNKSVKDKIIFSIFVRHFISKINNLLVLFASAIFFYHQEGISTQTDFIMRQESLTCRWREFNLFFYTPKDLKKKEKNEIVAGLDYWRNRIEKVQYFHGGHKKSWKLKNLPASWQSEHCSVFN